LHQVLGGSDLARNDTEPFGATHCINLQESGKPGCLLLPVLFEGFIFIHRTSKYGQSESNKLDPFLG